MRALAQTYQGLRQRLWLLRLLKTDPLHGGRGILQTVPSAQFLLRLPQEILPQRVLSQRILESVTPL